MANSCGVFVFLAISAGTLIVLLTLATPTSAQTTYASQYVNTYYTYRVRRYACRYYYYTYCYNWYYYRWWHYRWYYPYPYYYNWWYGWGYWPCCYRRPRSCCYYYYTTIRRSRRTCRNNWTGSRCNIPVCSPTCSNGQTCVNTDLTRNINSCSCLTQGGGTACQIEPCSPTNNCYPGTCKLSKCACPSGFTGSNCLTINQEPTIGECSVKLYAKPTPGATERVVGTATCAADDLEPLVVWVGSGLDLDRNDKGITKLEASWQAEYSNPLPMPQRPTTSFFIKNTPVQLGIVGGSFTISSDDFTSTKQYCQGLDESSPVTATVGQCVLLRTWTSLGFNRLLSHNNTMTITVANKLGGQKTGDAGYTYGGSSYGFGTQTFTGPDATKQARFQFDFERPTHCLLENDLADVIARNVNCTVFPISLDEDIRKDPVVNPRFLGWTDEASGLDRFEVEVYYLTAGISGTLQQQSTPEITATVKPELNNFQYTAPKPGDYAIVVTVYDGANNSAKARKIFNYDNQPGFTVTDAPVYFKESNPENRSFITKENPTKLTVTWAGRFLAKEAIRRVEPWPIDPYSIDDKYGTTFGLRSIAGMSSSTDISLSCYYHIDTRKSDRGFAEPQPLYSDGDRDSIPDGVIVGNCSVDSLTETATLEFDSPLRNGDTVIVWLNASDVSGTTSSSTMKVKATVDGSRPNVSTHEFVKNRDDNYDSYVEIIAFDRESGINETRYRIVDSRNDVVLVTGTAPATKRYAKGSKRRKRDAGPEKPCTADDKTCYCIPLGECFAYKQEIKIDHCDIDRYKGDDFKLNFLYVVNNGAGEDSPENKVSIGDLGDIECRPTPGLSAGVIAGISIAVIIGLLLLILLIVICVLMLIRIRQDKPAVPQRFRTMANQARKRFTMHSARTEDNELYTTNEQPPPAYPGQPRRHHDNPATTSDDDMYLDKVDLVPSKIPKRNLQMMDTLAEGRFAIVRKAQLHPDGKERSIVAAKALRNGFSKADEILMAQKIQYMSDVPPHGNIVRFIGEVEGGPEGPIMVLEMCEESLKNWLSQRSSLTTDDLEAFLGFSLNIAHGVEHLHSNKIIHRRLGVRNVLLQQQANGLVAKLIGFGPSAEDLDSSDKSGAGTSVPIKWLAPETLDTLNSKKPTYNEKTDAWSYGITLWEMYSKGAAPFSELRSTDVRGQLKRGYRMSCPPDCPPELFDKVVVLCWHDKASKRPSFSTICRAIEEFRHGGDTRTGYYAADDNARGGDEIYDDGQ